MQSFRVELPQQREGNKNAHGVEPCLPRGNQMCVGILDACTEGHKTQQKNPQKKENTRGKHSWAAEDRPEQKKATHGGSRKIGEGQKKLGGERGHNGRDTKGIRTKGRVIGVEIGENKHYGEGCDLKGGKWRKKDTKVKGKENARNRTVQEGGWRKGGGGLGGSKNEGAPNVSVVKILKKKRLRSMSAWKGLWRRIWT